MPEFAALSDRPLGMGAVAWLDLNVLEEIDRAVELGVMTRP